MVNQDSLCIERAAVIAELRQALAIVRSEPSNVQGFFEASISEISAQRRRLGVSEVDV